MVYRLLNPEAGKNLAASWRPLPSTDPRFLPGLSFSTIFNCT